jgi:hypothetical protein
MALAGNYRIDYYGDVIERIAKAVAPEVLRDVGRRIVEGAKDRSPYDTGHNRASIHVVAATGKIVDRQSPKGGRSFTAAGQFTAPGQVSVATSSGYGGYLEVGANLARYTRKGKRRAKRKGGGKGGSLGSYYITRAAAHVFADLGATEQAMQALMDVRAAQAGIRAERKARRA